jgi:L-alanine-DL-glutamate epimerase-like enolase superfamily enzyme
VLIATGVTRQPPSKDQALPAAGLGAAVAPHVTVVVDEAAAAQLANAEFYRYVLKYKPAQQKY